MHLNLGIKKNHHPIPRIDAIAPRLANAEVFSVVDAKDRFLQVESDEKFGISSAPEEFQRRFEECLEGLEQVEIIADDVVCYGVGKTFKEA